MIVAGERVGPYEVLSPLGAGGMGEVFRARDTRLGREVAIKVLSERLAASRDHLARFELEARSASALSHPAIVTIYEIEEHNGQPYIAMELIEGRSLRHYLSDNNLTMRRVLQIAAQLAEGLAAAHAKGIVHRDLKPENVMITSEGFVKVLDFGLAKLLPAMPDEDEKTAEFQSPESHPGRMIGTIGYMSPEQAAGKNLDFRSDQFSLGVILYEMVTGRRAFHKSNPVDTLSAILHEEPEEIIRINPRAPAPLRWIVERCLAKDPGERYASTSDLARELGTLRDRISETTGSLPAIEPYDRRRKPSAVRWWIAASVLAMAGIAGWMYVRHDTTAARVAVLPAKKLVALIPFRDLSGLPSGQLLSDGMTDTVAARLAAVPQLGIIPATSADRTDADSLQLAKKVGANLLLRGSMQRSAEEVRITYSIIALEGGLQVAAGTISGSSAELFAIQDRLADQILSDLGVATSERPPAVMASSTAWAASAQDKYLQAVGYLRRYENEASIDGAISLLEGLGDSVRTHATLGRAYLFKYNLTKKKQWADLATRQCRLALARDPASAEAHLTMGEVHVALRQSDEAIREFQKALAIEPRLADAVLGLGQACQYAGKLKEAEVHYREAIALRPGFWGGYNKLAVFYLVQGRYDEAVRNFREVVRLTPDNIRGYNNLGVTYQQMGRYDEALGAYAQSISVRPNADAFSNQGTCHFFLGHYREAAESFERATALDPDQAILWANLGDAYRWTKGAESKANAAYERAITRLEEELTVAPRHPALHTTIALCLAKSGRVREALSHMDLALELEPSDANVQYQAAVIQAIRGDEDAAIKRLSRAIAQGYSRAEAERDPELLGLRNHSGFKAAIETAPGKPPQS